MTFFDLFVTYVLPIESRFMERLFAEFRCRYCVVESKKRNHIRLLLYTFVCFQEIIIVFVLASIMFSYYISTVSHQVH